MKLCGLARDCPGRVSTRKLSSEFQAALTFRAVDGKGTVKEKERYRPSERPGSRAARPGVREAGRVGHESALWSAWPSKEIK